MLDSAQIEQFLLERRTWVSTEELCSTFGVLERVFRQIGDKPGVLTGIAISGDKGFKHISCATTTEWLRFKHRLRRHGIAELVRVATLDKRRQTKQMLLPLGAT